MFANFLIGPGRASTPRWWSHPAGVPVPRWLPAASARGDLQEAGILPGAGASAFDVSAAVPEDSWCGCVAERHCRLPRRYGLADAVGVVRLPRHRAGPVRAQNTAGHGASQVAHAAARGTLTHRAIGWTRRSDVAGDRDRGDGRGALMHRRAPRGLRFARDLRWGLVGGNLEVLCSCRSLDGCALQRR